MVRIYKRLASLHDFSKFQAISDACDILVDLFQVSNVVVFGKKGNKDFTDVLYYKGPAKMTYTEKIIHGECECMGVCVCECVNS